MRWRNEVYLQSSLTLEGRRILRQILVSGLGELGVVRSSANPNWSAIDSTDAEVGYRNKSEVRKRRTGSTTA